MSALLLAELIVSDPSNFNKSACVNTLAELAAELRHEKEICRFCTDDEHGTLSIYVHKNELLETEIRQLKSQIEELSDTPLEPEDVY